MDSRDHMLWCACGREPADLVLKNGIVLNVFTEELLPADVAICGDTIVGIGSYKGLQEIDCSGKFIVPGLVDSHVHIESGMASPGEFSKILAQAGTTTVIADPHEIVNVSGRAGLDYFLACAEKMLINAYFMLPSSVPADDRDINGCGEFLAEDMKYYVNHPRVLGLGETMRFMDCIEGEPRMQDKLRLFADKHIDGHGPMLTGHALQAYRLSGVETDHECSGYNEVIEKLRAGFSVLMREGSGAKNVEILLSALLEEGIPLDMCQFCTDDKHLAEIREDGHITTCIRIAISLGIPAAKAYRIATYQAARHYGLKHLGAVAAGFQADLLLLDDLDDPRPEAVMVKGHFLTNDDYAADLSVPMPYSLAHTVTLPRFTAKDIALPCGGTADIIGIIPDQILTSHRRNSVSVRDGFFVPDSRFNKLCMADRCTAILEGLGIHGGAVATTVAHDAHNLLVCGDNDKDILLAIETIREMGGGYAVIAGGSVVGALPLPIAGLMSDKPADEIIRTLEQLAAAARRLGVPDVVDPFVTLSFLALPVLPEARITVDGIYLT